MTGKAIFTVELPRTLYKAVEDFAAKDGISANSFILRAVTEKIAARGAAEFFAERGKNRDPTREIAFLEGRPE